MQTARQQEIIETALGLINENGIQSLTIKNLSKKLGITEPAIYRHFENKIQILVSILDLMKQNSNDIFSSELKSEESAAQKIEQLFKKHFRSFSEMPSLASVVFSEEMFRNEKVLIEKISELIEQNNKILLTILNEGQNNNELRNDIDAAHLAVIIMGALRLFVKKWQISGFTFDLQDEGNKLIQSVKLIILK
ncbi:TetR/AcrR family transcriptional regulator [Gaoshiqia sediminis]|uniref:TetR/AcrR family transcriptional regulator n=1 Tax=Gaoshiqia sediminis TaxID=2986998 RepID=A0AA41Y7E8_9BACT|nr:TetR/AcrR family transcriptional regulator [Gaoshiqia sediminis]MCW0482278.1 TetR/AcrR family transcriptional regulator [Gaoshiqia sediminis]